MHWFDRLGGFWFGCWSGLINRNRSIVFKLVNLKPWFFLPFLLLKRLIKASSSYVAASNSILKEQHNVTSFAAIKGLNWYSDIVLSQMYLELGDKPDQWSSLIFLKPRILVGFPNQDFGMFLLRWLSTIYRDKHQRRLENILPCLFDVIFKAFFLISRHINVSHFTFILIQCFILRQTNI